MSAEFYLQYYNVRVFTAKHYIKVRAVERLILLIALIAQLMYFNRALIVI